MSTLYYCACVTCKTLVDLDKFYLVPSDDEFFDIEEYVRLYERGTAYNRHCIFLLTFLQRHSGHTIVFGNSDALDQQIDNWYDTYKRELEVYL